MPAPSAELQRTSFCYQGVVADTRLSTVLPRPRVSVALPAGLTLEGSYIPPVTLGDARAHVGSLALSVARPVRGVWAKAAALTLGLRAHGTVGRIRGPVTCPSSVLQQGDATAPCYGTAPSNDTFRPQVVGVEGAVGVAPLGGRVALYGGGGVTRLAPRFEVGFRDANGVVDRTRVEVDLTRGALFGGAAVRLKGAAELSGQLYSVPSDATVWRVSLGYRVR